MDPVQAFIIGFTIPFAFVLVLYIIPVAMWRGLDRFLEWLFDKLGWHC